jgi:hypothetical protein
MDISALRHYRRGLAYYDCVLSKKGIYPLYCAMVFRYNSSIFLKLDTRFLMRKNFFIRILVKSLTRTDYALSKLEDTPTAGFSGLLAKISKLLIYLSSYVLQGIIWWTIIHIYLLTKVIKDRKVAGTRHLMRVLKNGNPRSYFH